MQVKALAAPWNQKSKWDWSARAANYVSRQFSVAMLCGRGGIFDRRFIRIGGTVIAARSEPASEGRRYKRQEPKRRGTRDERRKTKDERQKTKDKRRKTKDGKIKDSPGSLLRGDGISREGDEVNGLDGVAEFAPGVQSALQRADAFDALFSEEQRHTGAGSFVWSSTVENDFTILGQAIVFLFELLGIHAESAGHGFGVV